MNIEFRDERTIALIGETAFEKRVLNMYYSHNHDMQLKLINNGDTLFILAGGAD